MRKFVIVEHRAKELANCLWNDLSISAYGMETGAQIVNRTRLEHVRFWRFFHMFYARLIDVVTRKTCGVWTTGSPKFLPPTAPLSKKFDECSTLYFFGWLFRNPSGLERYRDALVATFAPNKYVQERIQNRMAPLKDKHIRIGIHIKQKPFRGFENGEFLVSPARVRVIVDEYIRERGLTADAVALVITSDGNVDVAVFAGYATTICIDDEETKLFLLSKCDVIIGTNSTLSNLAAWFGNALHIVTTNETIDWAYYAGKSTYIDNKYATFTHGSLLYP